MKKGFFTALVFVISLCTTFVVAQAANPIIVVESFSPAEIHELGLHSVSGGLTTVGTGELVYLSALDSSSYTWSIIDQPDGSAATLDSTDTRMTTFRPDVTGQFEIQLSTTEGDTTVVITSSTFVGAGIPEECVADPYESGCFCHNTKVTEWAASGHAYLFQLGIEGKDSPSSHYNEGCIECHTLGFNTDPEAVNGGFDDVALEVGWEFPETLKEGNWADLKTNYRKLAKLASIQCENCHGPASEHRYDFKPEKMAVSVDAGVCHVCHDEPWRHKNSKQWKNSVHNFDQLGSHPTNSGCQPCHSGSGLVEYLGGSKWNPNNPGNVSCAACHDPHTAELREAKPVVLENGVAIDFGGEGLLCMTCHHDRRDAPVYAEEYHSRFGPHHSPQTDMLAGTNAITFGLHIPSSTHRDAIPNSCVDCHMAPTPGSGVEPAEGQYGRDYIGEHSFAMSWDGGTPDDESDDIDNVIACERCHGALTTFDDIKAREDYDGNGKIEGVRVELKGIHDQVGMLLPPVGEPSVSVTSSYNKIQLKAAYNHAFIEDDASFGMHNYQFAIGLMKVSKAALEYGILSAGQILGVADIPNDQGKQVRVSWDRFGGDGVSDNPVRTYAVLRRIDAPMAVIKKNNKNLIESFEAMASLTDNVTPGTQVALEDGGWDVVGIVPAAAAEQYNAVVPTLYDSTKDAGVQFSVFRVMAITGMPAINAVSAPDSGYSIDNLAPAPPANVAGTIIEAGAELTWDESIDADFKYFTVYRSMSKNFNPANAEAIAKISETRYVDATIEAGKTYYYKVTATDFAGNEGLGSSEVTVIVMGIYSENAIPTEFILNQNYPNPFNPSTVIRFGLPGVQQVTVKIYDIRGSLVRTLAQGRFSAGYHNLTWDGRDESGQLVSAGTYIYQIVSASEKISKKMVFLK
ncbi:T9SS type A sorting domain-containing protein [candidate division KSB1 bacterium]|nr:T9SS type A sorting domain-containing protein [candidate division KSB1 bacterium]